MEGGEPRGRGAGVAVPSPPLDGARRLRRARLEPQKDDRGQEHGGEEQEEDDPGAEVCALAQPGRVGGDQVGQVQHVAKRPADRGVPGLRAKGAASAWAQLRRPRPAPRPRPPPRPAGSHLLLEGHASEGAFVEAVATA